MNVNIEGIEVVFPFKPYDIQIDYMRCVIQALQQKENAILESPTGTGKTLSLLCSTLAWLDFRKYKQLTTVLEPSQAENKGDEITLDLSNFLVGDQDKKSNKGKGKGKGWEGETPIRVIYTSRTHSQLNQACKELKNSYYNYTPSVTIGSREQLCINEEVRNNESISAKNQACRHKVKNNECKFHHNYESSISDMSMQGQYVYDIEDLLSFGSKRQACPYYMAKAKAEFNTSLIFMPYNYVLNPDIRKTLNINLNNAVIIFDEGHNIEKVCEDSMSVELRSDWLASTINSFDDLLLNIQRLETGEAVGDLKLLTDLNVLDVTRGKMALIDFERRIDAFVRSPGQKNTAQVFELLAACNINFEEFFVMVNVCEKLTEYTMSVKNYTTNVKVNSIVSVIGFLERFICKAKEPEAIQNFAKEMKRDYRISCEVDQRDSNHWTFHLWCMTPSVAIKSLMREGVHNIIITSGTLTPVESFDVEMGIPFKIKLQNDHVISDKQLSFLLIGKDPNGVELNNAYNNRSSKYYDGLGYTVIEVARNVPKGVFIFFASYSLMNSCMEAWKSFRGHDIWKKITGLKRVFFEPRNRDDFAGKIDEFRQAIENNKNGAIFMAVSRGKLSEGIDLSDDYCRAVVIIGLPYPAVADPRVMLKKKYLDEIRSGFSGNEWYMLQMKRALNQSIGRVIRHKADYGSIIMCDSRFRTLQSGLPKWIRKFLSSNLANGADDFGLNIQKLGTFFDVAQGGEFNHVQRNRAVAPKPTSHLPKREPVVKYWNGQKPAMVKSEADEAFQDTFNRMKDVVDTSMFDSRPSQSTNVGSIFQSLDSGYSSQSNSQKRTLSGANLYSVNSKPIAPATFTTTSSTSKPTSTPYNNVNIYKRSKPPKSASKDTTGHKITSYFALLSKNERKQSN